MASSDTDSPVVLHLIASLNIGGTERQLVQFINRSSNPGRHTVALFDEMGPLASQVPVPPVLIGSFGRRPLEYPGNVRAVRRLRKLILDLRVDIVHAHLGVSELLAAAAVPRSIPLVASRRGRNVGFEASRWLKVVEGFGHRRVDLLLCNSRYLAEYTREHDLWPPPTRVIYNGVDLERFGPADLPPIDRPTIAMVANLKWYKRQKDFLRALALVAAEVPQIRAVLAGDGSDRPALERLVADLGLRDNVQMPGQVQDVREFVARAHVVTLTSLHEGFPNALLEGMAMGRPVVATRAGGIPELVRDGLDGLLVERDPRSIADAFLSLFGDPARLAAMGASALTRAREFTWDRVVEETEAVYRELLSRRGRSGVGPQEKESSCAG